MTRSTRQLLCAALFCFGALPGTWGSNPAYLGDGRALGFSRPEIVSAAPNFPGMMGIAGAEYSSVPTGFYPAGSPEDSKSRAEISAHAQSLAYRNSKPTTSSHFAPTAGKQHKTDRALTGSKKQTALANNKPGAGAPVLGNPRGRRSNPVESTLFYGIPFGANLVYIPMPMVEKPAPPKPKPAETGRPIPFLALDSPPSCSISLQPWIDDACQHPVPDQKDTVKFHTDLDEASFTKVPCFPSKYFVLSKYPADSYGVLCNDKVLVLEEDSTKLIPETGNLAVVFSKSPLELKHSSEFSEDLRMQLFRKSISPEVPSRLVRRIPSHRSVSYCAPRNTTLIFGPSDIFMGPPYTYAVEADAVKVLGNTKEPARRYLVASKTEGTNRTEQSVYTFLDARTDPSKYFDASSQDPGRPQSISISGKMLKLDMTQELEKVLENLEALQKAYKLFGLPDDGATCAQGLGMFDTLPRVFSHVPAESSETLCIHAENALISLTSMATEYSHLIMSSHPYKYTAEDLLRGMASCAEKADKKYAEAVEGCASQPGGWGFGTYLPLSHGRRSIITDVFSRGPCVSPAFYTDQNILPYVEQMYLFTLGGMAAEKDVADDSYPETRKINGLLEYYRLHARMRGTQPRSPGGANRDMFLCIFEAKRQHVLETLEGIGRVRARISTRQAHSGSQSDKPNAPNLTREEMRQIVFDSTSILKNDLESRHTEARALREALTRAANTYDFSGALDDLREIHLDTSPTPDEARTESAQSILDAPSGPLLLNLRELLAHAQSTIAKLKDLTSSAIYDYVFSAPRTKMAILSPEMEKAKAYMQELLGFLSENASLERILLHDENPSGLFRDVIADRLLRAYENVLLLMHQQVEDIISKQYAGIDAARSEKEAQNTFWETATKEIDRYYRKRILECLHSTQILRQVRALLDGEEASGEASEYSAQKILAPLLRVFGAPQTQLSPEFSFLVAQDLQDAPKEARISPFLEPRRRTEEEIRESGLFPDGISSKERMSHIRSFYHRSQDTDAPSALRSHTWENYQAVREGIRNNLRTNPQCVAYQKSILNQTPAAYANSTSRYAEEKARNEIMQDLAIQSVGGAKILEVLRASCSEYDALDEVPLLPRLIYAFEKIGDELLFHFNWVYIPKDLRQKKRAVFVSVLIADAVNKALGEDPDASSPAVDTEDVQAIVEHLYEKYGAEVEMYRRRKRPSRKQRPIRNHSVDAVQKSHSVDTAMQIADSSNQTKPQKKTLKRNAIKYMAQLAQLSLDINELVFSGILSHKQLAVSQEMRDILGGKGLNRMGLSDIADRCSTILVDVFSWVHLLLSIIENDGNRMQACRKNTEIIQKYNAYLGRARKDLAGQKPRKKLPERQPLQQGR